MKKIKLLCLSLCLIALNLTTLTSCSALAQTPPSESVRQAIIQQQMDRQQMDTQKAIAPDLGLSTATDSIPDFKIGKVFIESREKLSDSALRRQAAADGAYIDGLYKVTGTYSSTSTQGEETTAQRNPFEVYLGNRPKSMRSTVSAAEAAEKWYLLSPQSATPLP